MRRSPLPPFAMAMLAATAAYAAPGPAMTVDDFLGKWQAIKVAEKVPDQRPEAVKETFELSQVLATYFGDYKAALESDKRAGKPPRACPIKGSKLNFTLDELVGNFSALPSDERQGSAEQAYFAFLDTKLPCRTI